MHSFTTAKLPSPITFPTLYFSRMVDVSEYLFPFIPSRYKKVNVRENTNINNCYRIVKIQT